MSTTTSYGTWANVMGARSVESDVVTSLGDFADHFDVDPLIDAYRAAVNTALPDGVTLNGDEFYGPVPRQLDKDTMRDMCTSVDFWALAERFDRYR